MKVGIRAFNSARIRLAKYVKTHNMRPSAVRNHVLELACGLNQPFTADQLVTVCRIEKISVGTVYNSLDTFVKAGVFRGTQRQRGHIATEYELISDSGKHMQIICTKCGRVTEFSDVILSKLIKERKYSNFVVHQYSLVIYGECRTCRNKKKNDS